MTLPAETVVTSAHAARFESALGTKSSAHLNEEMKIGFTGVPSWVPHKFMFVFVVSDGRFCSGSVGACWFMYVQRMVGVYRTLDEVPLHLLIYVSFAASKSRVNSHAE